MGVAVIGRDLAVVQPAIKASRYRQYRFTLRRNSKKAWPELQWRHSDNRVTLRMPVSTPLPACIDAFERRVPWFDVFSNRTAKPGLGDILPLDGAACQVVHSPQLETAVRHDSGVVWVRNAAPSRLERDLLKLVSDKTLDAMRGYVAHMARQIDMQPGHIRLSSAMRKWGACDHRNNLNFSWRLSMAPPFVQEYLAAHEVAHFQHKHHRESFWQTVNDLLPTWMEGEHWLAFCGSTLMTTQLGAIAPTQPGQQLHSVR